jgi:leucyl-tRNA synthetase
MSPTREKELKIMSEQVETPPFRYTAALAQKIEADWQRHWAEHGTFNAPNPVGALADPSHPRSGAPKQFVLDMFPYPSGAGLHVGHPLGFIGTDVYARFQRMAGFNVLHTMGFDAFGLPAEQYAVQTGTHPRTTTEDNISRYRAQLRMLGLGHDPRRSVATTDVGYYRWTQWIFLQIFNSWFDPQTQTARPIAILEERLAHLPEDERNRIVDEHRLAYVSEAPVNWCPGLGTVLANEEVTADGRSERGNFPVFKRSLKQWMMRITAYGDRLIDDLDYLNWPEAIKLMQRNWIGRSTGASIDFASEAGPIRVFTHAARHRVRRHLHGAGARARAGRQTGRGCVAAGDAREVDRWAHHPGRGGRGLSRVRRVQDRGRAAGTSKEKTGRLHRAYATNPVNGAAFRLHRRLRAGRLRHRRDHGGARPGRARLGFAEVFELPIIRTVQLRGFRRQGLRRRGRRSTRLPGRLGSPSEGAISSGWSRRTRPGATTYRLRDWLFSRQRYWGEPFPIVYDETGLPIALPESMLPVELPDVDDFSPRTFELDDVESDPEAPLSRGQGVGRGHAGPGRRPRRSTGARPT